MAYNFMQVTDDEEDQTKPGGGSPSSAPPATSIGTAMGGGASPAPQQPTAQAATGPRPQSAQEQHGTGFTNLKSWLDAGSGRSGNIKSASDKSYTDEDTSLQKAVGDTRSQIQSTAPITAAGEAAKMIDGENVASPNHSALTATDPNSVIDPTGVLLDREASGVHTNLDKVVNQQYDGPAGLTWQSGQGATDLGMLSSADTAANATAKDAINEGRYGRGMRALDSAIYGADPDSVKAMTGASNNLGELNVHAIDAGDGMADLADRQRAAIDKARNDARAGLTSDRDKLLAGIDTRVDSTNNRLATAMGDTSAPAGMTQGAWVGATPGMANRANSSGQMERKQLNAFDRFLGGDGGYDEFAPSHAIEGHRTYTATPPPPTAAADASHPGAKWLAPAELKKSFAGRDPGFMGNNDYGQGAWVDENGNLLRGNGNMAGVLSGYNYDSSTGEYIDAQTGERISKKDVDNNMYQFDGQTGKLRRLDQQAGPAHF